MKSRNDKRTKKISILVILGLLICMVLSVPTMASETSGVKGKSCYTHGDVNADGSVTSKDAIRLLYYATLEGEYSVEQDCDFNGDNEIDTRDAVHLLYSVNGLFADLLPGYGLNGVIHAYDEPIWTWNFEETTPTATASYKCACGASAKVVAATVEAGAKSEPTCTAAGSQIYSASATFADVTYTTTKTTVLNATGHTYETEASCQEDRECQVCGYVDKASGHVYGEPKVTESTCTLPKTTTSVCYVCEYEHVVPEGTALGHTLNTEPKSVLVNAGTCEYKLVYTCSTCNENIDGGVVTNHNYVAAITKEATCKEVGTKTYACSGCGDSYTEDIAANENAHAWGEGSENGDITTYTCSLCNEDRRTVNASDSTSAEVSQKSLQTAGEVEVNNAAIKLDNATLTQLNNVESTSENNDVVISVEETNKSTLNNVSAETLAQIGDNPVYDFTMTVGGVEVSEFDGKVTISLPYALQSDEDADSIDVWYIADNGELTVVQGVYSNGYVTFTTDHFSYYTVTRLTPKQRCEKYNHSETTRTVDVTCESDGYTLHVCVRCAETWKTDEVERLVHEYNEITVAPTCATDGTKTETCEHCQDVRTTKLPKLGHKWEISEETAATCGQEGKIVASCANCEETKTEIVKQLSHKFEETVTAPACDSKGYTLKKCTACGYEVKENEVNALGHTYKAAWDWTKDGIGATLTLTCEKDAAHSIVKDATISIVKQNAATCAKDGSITYKASVSYNQQTYTDEYEVTEEKYGHEKSEELHHNASSHYYVCTVCNEKVEAEDHKFDDGQVVTEATCTEPAVKLFTCACGYKVEQEETIIGHTFENSVCTNCGFKADGCTHEDLYYVEEKIPTESGICGGTAGYYRCDCGQEKSADYVVIDCDLYFKQEITEDENGYPIDTRTAVCDRCQAVVKRADYWSVTENCEGTHYQKHSITSKDGELIYEIESKSYEENHPTILYGEKEDLAQYGMCEGVIYSATCPCGEAYSFVEESDCFWEYDPENSTNSVSASYCSKCGTQKKAEYTEAAVDECYSANKSTVTYSKDGAVLFTKDGLSIWENHDLTTEFKLNGTTCSEGFTAIETCKNCDYKDLWEVKAGELEEDDHMTHLGSSEKIELPEGACEGYLYKEVCPCGKDVYCYHSGACDTEYKETCDEEGNVISSVEKCTECGLRIEWVASYKNTEYSCVKERTSTETFWFGDTKLEEVTSEVKLKDCSEYEETTYKLLGETCEDGVQITTECTECGDSSYYTTYWHETFEKEHYDLSDYGMCGGAISVHGCACGEENWYIEEDTEDGCDWLWWYYDDETDTEIHKCNLCGALKHESHESVDLEGCLAQYVDRIEYLKGYNVVLTVESIRQNISHNQEFTFELDVENGTCSDGYTVNWVCKDCKETGSWHEKPTDGEHWIYGTEAYNLADYGFCGGSVGVSSCPCGERKNVYNDTSNGCNWNWYKEDEATGIDWYRCLECNQYYSEQYVEISKEGCYRNQERTVTFYDENQIEVLSVKGIERWQEHDTKFAFEMNGASCSDGYTVAETCKNCDYSHSYYNKTSEGEHNTYRLNSYNLKDFGYCGGVVYKSGCPCGAESYYHWEFECNFETTDYDEETDMYTYTCNDCKNSYTACIQSAQIDACHILYEEQYHFYDNAGNEVLTFETTNTRPDHRYIYTFELLGESCEDGYYVTETCKDCQESHIGDYLYTDHNYWTLDYVNLEEKGLCGGTGEYRGCACGRDSLWNFNNSCSWSNDSEWVDGIYTDTCTGCGIAREMTYTSTEIDSCCSQGVCNTRFLKDGEEVWTIEEHVYEENHQYVYKFEFMEGSQTCEEGYYANGTCVKCDDQVTGEEYGCSGYCINIVDAAKLGMCGGHFEEYSCPCGADSWVDTYEECNWEYQGEGEYGSEIYKCSECNTIQEFTYEESEKDENCYITTKRTWVYKDAEENEMYRIVGNSDYTNHEYMHSFELLGESCEDGYYVTETCKDCQESHIGDYLYTDHNYWTLDYVDLKEKGLCGGTGEYRGCACGRDGLWNFYNSCSWSNNSEWVDGTYTDTCTECGIAREMTYTSTEIDSCHSQGVCNTRFLKDEEEVWTIEEYVYEQNHQYVYEFEFMEESQTCEDGYYANGTCIECSASVKNEGYWHDTYELSRIDLSALGSVCGGYLVKTGCACGERVSLELEDYICDCDYQYTEAWLGDDLEAQQTTEGYYGFYSDGWIQTCAVTDPEQCGFAVRQCRYWKWDKENCSAAEYQTWQLGYDAETGTCAEEITIATGEVHTYHDYKCTETTEIDENGNEVMTESHVCSVCGSSYVETSVHDVNEGGGLTQLSRTEECINTLDNGDDRSFRYHWEYSNYKILNRIVLDYREYVDASGETSWSKTETTYDNSNCSYVDVMTDSDGNYEVREGVDHWEDAAYETIKESTCSQSGERHVTTTCLLCDQILSEETEDTAPYGHNWYYDDEKAVYVCYDCGLENANGADGSIIIEDLTERYGNGTSYVVGYYMNTEVEFVYNLSAVSEDGTEVVLENVTFTEMTREVDDIQAISFNKAEAEAAAKAVVSGTYSLRFSFVPYGSDSSLDYAITFDAAITE